VLEIPNHIVAVVVCVALERVVVVVVVVILIDVMFVDCAHMQKAQNAHLSPCASQQGPGGLAKHNSPRLLRWTAHWTASTIHSSAVVGRTVYAPIHIYNSY